jgi:hypothetical protein
MGLDILPEPNSLLGVFSGPHTSILFFILIQYVLFWVEYNLKYHKSEITFHLILLVKIRKIVFCIIVMNDW